MGVVAKLKQQVADTFGAGVHLVIIDDMKMARNKFGQIMANEETGEHAIDVTFKSGEGKKISRVFWMTEKSRWVFEKLCKAVKFELNQGTQSVNDIKGRRLWICVGTKYIFENEKIKLDSTGRILTLNHVLAMFYEVFDPMIPPAVLGDPKLTDDGLPDGKFLMNKPEELPVDWKDQIWKNT